MPVVTDDRCARERGEAEIERITEDDHSTLTTQRSRFTNAMPAADRIRARQSAFAHRRNQPMIDALRYFTC